MAYCPRCGVQVEDRLDRCPLCDTSIPEEVRTDIEKPTYPTDVIPPKEMYRPLTDRERKRLYRGILAIFALFPIALTMLLDLYRNGSISWSFYVLVPVSATAIVSWLFFRYGRRPLISVNGAFIVILAVIVLFIPSEAMQVIAPYVLLVGAAAEILLVYIAVLRPRASGIVIVSAIVTAGFLFGLDITIWAQSHLAEANLEGFPSAWFAAPGSGWSLIVGAVLVPIAIYTVYLRITRKRGLNVAGFFFLDLTIMLLGIDVAAGGNLGWAAVNALIFVPMAIIFYALHIALFNDTDWRKALHL